MCHVKFDSYKKLSTVAYKATPRCVAENIAKFLKITRKYTGE